MPCALSPKPSMYRLLLCVRTQRTIKGKPTEPRYNLYQERGFQGLISGVLDQDAIKQLDQDSWRRILRQIGSPATKGDLEKGLIEAGMNELQAKEVPSTPSLWYPKRYHGAVSFGTQRGALILHAWYPKGYLVAKCL
eukprot:1612598-Rhodomonas_salina.1